MGRTVPRPEESAPINPRNGRPGTFQFRKWKWRWWLSANEFAFLFFPTEKLFYYQNELSRAFWIIMSVENFHIFFSFTPFREKGEVFSGTINDSRYLFEMDCPGPNYSIIPFAPPAPTPRHYPLQIDIISNRFFRAIYYQALGTARAGEVELPGTSD